MRRFVEEADRGQWTLLPECLDDFIDESNPVRVIDVFVDMLDLAEIDVPHCFGKCGTSGCRWDRARAYKYKEWHRLNLIDRGRVRGARQDCCDGQTSDELPPLHDSPPWGSRREHHTA
jgi:hypothetical protein